MQGTNYPVITTGNIATTVDSYNSALLNNGAVVPPGSDYQLPINEAQVSQNGIGAPQRIKYVRYLSTAATAFVAYPGLVYWVDETLTSVTGLYSEGAFGINGVAGWMMINTATYPGSLTGAQLRDAVKGNFIWIVTGGFIPSAYSAGSVAAGDYLIGSTTAFQPARMAANSAPTNTVAGLALSAVSSNVSDVLVKPFGPSF